VARVLVTGANGHIGCSLVPELVARGHQVVPFVRASADTSGLDGLGLAYARGDVLDAASVEAAIGGCDVVVHMAAVFATRTRDPDAIMRPAVEGTRIVLEAAARAGVKRVVYTSSVAAVGPSRREGVLRTEANWNEEARLPYVRAKTESERQAWKHAERLGLPLVVLCPGTILGRGDFRITPSNRLIRDLATRKALTGVGGMSLVDVRDVAAAHAQAIDRGEPGGRYIVTGENVTLRRIGELVGERTGKRAPHLPLPRWMALAGVAVISAIERLLGREPGVTLAEAREAAGRWSWFDDSRSRAALGLEPRSAREAIDDALFWLLERRELPAPIAARLAERGLPAPAADADRPAA
jgi:dihydroflavonol-4-reductase